MTSKEFASRLFVGVKSLLTLSQEELFKIGRAAVDSQFGDPFVETPEGVSFEIEYSVVWGRAKEGIDRIGEAKNPADQRDRILRSAALLLILATSLSER